MIFPEKTKKAKREKKEHRGCRLVLFGRNIYPKFIIICIFEKALSTNAQNSM